MRVDKCSCERRQEDGEERILGQGLHAVEPGHTVEAVSKTNCRDKHFDGIARNEPGNRTQRHACLQISESKPNKGCEDEQWPDTDPDQQQPCYQDRATWPKRPHSL